MATGQQKLTTYLPPVEAEQLRALAERDGRTVTGLLRLLARRYMQIEAEPTGSTQSNTVGSDSKGA